MKKLWLFGPLSFLEIQTRTRFASFGEATIHRIIEQEDPRKPLSDSKIVSILQREGLVLARRTIAKYREELKISTSNRRKVLY